MTKKPHPKPKKAIFYITFLLTVLLGMLLTLPILWVYDGGMGNEVSAIEIILTDPDECFMDPYGVHTECMYLFGYSHAIKSCKEKSWSGCVISVGNIEFEQNEETGKYWYKDKFWMVEFK